MTGHMGEAVCLEINNYCSTFPLHVLVKVQMQFEEHSVTAAYLFNSPFLFLVIIMTM